jgi:CBS domain-containing protein
MNEMALKTFRFPENTCIPQAQPAHKGSVTLTSPGRLVMTDLVLIKASTIAPDTSLERAEQVMIHQGVRLLFVVSNLSGEKPVRLVTQRNVRYEDLSVADVMSELSMIDAIDYDDLKTSNVAKVIATFKKFGRKHLLVVQGATLHASARIRGVISLTQLERQLGQSVATTEIASTFAEIEQALV